MPRASAPSVLSVVGFVETGVVPGKVEAGGYGADEIRCRNRQHGSSIV